MIVSLAGLSNPTFEMRLKVGKTSLESGKYALQLRVQAAFPKSPHTRLFSVQPLCSLCLCG